MCSTHCCIRDVTCLQRRQAPVQSVRSTILLPQGRHGGLPLPAQMLGELMTAGLGPAHVDSLYELCDRVRAAEQDKDPPPPIGLLLRSWSL